MAIALPLDGALAVAIIRAWKADAALRAEFRSINTYSAFVRGRADERARIMALQPGPADAEGRCPVPAGLTAESSPAAISAQIARGFPVAPGAAARISPFSPATAEPPGCKKPMTSREASMHLSARFTYHTQRLTQTGMRHGAACIEARRLVSAERASIEFAQG